MYRREEFGKNTAQRLAFGDEAEVSSSAGTGERYRALAGVYPGRWGDRPRHRWSFNGPTAKLTARLFSRARLRCRVEHRRPEEPYLSTLRSSCASAL